MRKLLLIGGAAALIALPSAALADEPEQIDEPDPTAEAAAGTTTTDKALHAEGNGGFSYEGSGGTTVTGRGVVAVKDLSATHVIVNGKPFDPNAATATRRPPADARPEWLDDKI